MAHDRDPADVDLDAWLYPDDEIPSGTSSQLAPPPDADRADRMLAARTRQLARITEVHALATQRQAEIREWESAQTGKLAGRVDWLTGSLTAWHAAVIRVDPSRTSIALPSGTLKAVKVSGGAEWEWSDDAATLAYLAAEAAALVRTPAPAAPKPAPDRAAVKSATVIVDDVVAAREARRAFIAGAGPDGSESVYPARFVAAAGGDGELVPVLDLDTGQPVPGVMVRRVARRFTIR